MASICLSDCAYRGKLSFAGFVALNRKKIVYINKKRFMNPFDIMMKRITFEENNTLKDKNNFYTNGIYS